VQQTQGFWQGSLTYLWVKEPDESIPVAGALWHNRLIATLTLGGHMDEEIKLKFAEMQAVIDALKAGVKRRPCHERAGKFVF
jgi:hypothetical protein